MKKIFSISFALLILLAGMHLTISTHICGGEVAATKWSFLNEKASCGMEAALKDCATPKGLASNCCHNEISVYTVDSNYNPSFTQNKEFTKNILHIYLALLNIDYQSVCVSHLFNEHFTPPNDLLTSVVRLVDICVFRI